MITIKTKPCHVVARFQVDLIRPNSIVSTLTRAASLGLLSAAMANPTNVRVNPGAEVGDSGRWTRKADPVNRPQRFYRVQTQ